MSQKELAFTPRKTAMLTSAKEYALFKWLEKHAEEFRTTYNDEVAAMATEDLEFEVAPANIKHARTVLGLPPPRTARQVSRGQTPEQILAHELIRVMKHIDLPVPLALLEVANEFPSDSR